MYISLIFVGLGCFEFSISWKLVKTGIKTEARVVDIMEYTDRNGADKKQITYKSVFEYTDRSGSRVRFNGKGGAISPDKIGEIVKIIYLPNKKQEKIDSFWGLYFDPLIWWAVALITCILGLRIIRQHRYGTEL